MSSSITVRLADEVKMRLDQLAEATQRRRASLAAQAIGEFVEDNEWQVGEIRAALQEADAGEFANGQEFAGLARKWKVNAR